ASLPALPPIRQKHAASTKRQFLTGFGAQIENFLIGAHCSMPLQKGGKNPTFVQRRCHAYAVI
ncbi:MAG: hypothetical protein ACK4GE_06580, partial [Caldimicrobium sp.]